MTVKTVFPDHNITDIDIRTRHVIVFRLLSYIGQNVNGTRTEEIYKQSYIREGLDVTDNECRLIVRDMFISCKNVGLFIDVSLKAGKGYMLAVTYGGRRYWPYLQQGLPDEDERRKQFELSDIVELWDLEMGSKNGTNEETRNQ